MQCLEEPSVVNLDLAASLGEEYISGLMTRPVAKLTNKVASNHCSCITLISQNLSLCNFYSSENF